MSTVDIDKPTAIADNTGTLHIFQRGMTHEPNLCPECVFSEATQALIAQERTTLKAELLAKMPKPTIGAPVDKYETGGECGAYADGYNKAITEITKLVEEL